MTTTAKMWAARHAFTQVENAIEWSGDPDALELGVVIAVLMRQLQERIDLFDLDGTQIEETA